MLASLGTKHSDPDQLNACGELTSTVFTLGLLICFYLFVSK